MSREDAGRYLATEYNVGTGGIEAVVMPQMQVPAQLAIDMREGRSVFSGPVRHPEDTGESCVTVVWGPGSEGDGSRTLLAWYEMAPQ